MKIVKTITSDDLVLNGLLSEPPLLKNKIVIHVHGMAGSIVLEDFYQIMHEQYVKSGFSFLAGENRGLGVVTPFMQSSSGKLKLFGSALEKFEKGQVDIKAWVDYALSLGYKEIWLQGHSLGCSKIAYYLEKHSSDHIKGVIFISPAGMLGLAKVLQGKSIIDRAGKLIKAGKGKELIHNKVWRSGFLSADTIMNFFGKKSNMNIFRFTNHDTKWTVINKIEVPVLAITGTKDEGIVLLEDPYEAMEKLKKELIRSPKTKTVVLENASHMFMGFGKQIANEVINFLKK